MKDGDLGIESERPMTTSTLDRLLFAQGNNCFFCENPLARSQASVEHLLAKAHDGSNALDNCVACCKSVNALFGSMTLKEKIRVVLKQHGKFRCPMTSGRSKCSSPCNPSKEKPASSDKHFQIVLANLTARKSGRPGSEKALRNEIATILPGLNAVELDAMVGKLKALGKVRSEGERVIYAL